MTRTKALHLRAMIEKAVASLNDTEALTAVELFPEWKTDTAYTADYRVRYQGQLYRVIQAHTSHSAYPPDITVSLYAEILIPDPSVIPEWVQPSSTNPYMRGDKVRHFEKIWESAIDYNVYEPGTVGTETLWIEVQA